MAAFEYRDDAQERKGGYLMRGALLRRSNGRLVTGSYTGAPDSRSMVGYEGRVWHLARCIYIHQNGDLPADLLVDHRDRDPTHNRKSNLRALTNSANQMNRSSSRSGSAVPYIGVVLHKGAYAAFVTVDSRPELLHTSRDPVECARARDRWVRENHGDYATLNCDLFSEVKD